MIDENPIRGRCQAVRHALDERGRRLHAAAEASAAGYGGIAATSRATKVTRSTIGRGLKDLQDPTALNGRIRRPGAGRPKMIATDPTRWTTCASYWHRRRWAIRCVRCAGY